MVDIVILDLMILIQKWKKLDTMKGETIKQRILRMTIIIIFFEKKKKYSRNG